MWTSVYWYLWVISKLFKLFWVENLLRHLDDVLALLWSFLYFSSKEKTTSSCHLKTRFITIITIIISSSSIKSSKNLSYIQEFQNDQVHKQITLFQCTWLANLSKGRQLLPWNHYGHLKNSNCVSVIIIVPTRVIFLLNACFHWVVIFPIINYTLCQVLGLWGMEADTDVSKHCSDYLQQRWYAEFLAKINLLNKIHKKHLKSSQLQTNFDTLVFCVFVLQEINRKCYLVFVTCMTDFCLTGSISPVRPNVLTFFFQFLGNLCAFTSS